MFNTSTLARRARLTSALSLATLLSVGIWSPTQAAPDPNPPIGGGLDRRAGQNNSNRADVLRGTVDRVFSARSFDLRADDGRIYRVNMRFALGLEARSNVRVRGDLNGSTFDARTVTVGEFKDDRYNDDPYNDNNGGDYGNGGYNNNGNGGHNNNGNGGYNNNGNGGYNNNGDYNNNGNNGQYQGQTVTLRGQVTRVFSRTDIEVRDDDDGRIYRVQSDKPFNSVVREGDRIEVRGELNGNTIRADSSSGIGADNGNYGGNNNDANFVTFSGPIESIDLNREEATVRAGNGYVYTIRASRSQLDDYRVGQRVRVQGNWINQRVEVTQISRD